MDRKSILNCSLVSTHWHGPARIELARMMQDMPYNGQGLVHAIRTRFANDTFPFVSMAQFDKLVCNLSEIYYHSNPETKEVFAPAYPPDILYQLFWTFLFIDQEFRNPRTRPKVTCSYFVRLLQEEEAGYPRHYFDKKVLKSIYNDIKSKPLLPAPHLIRAWQEGDVSTHHNNNNPDPIDNSGSSNTAGGRRPTMRPRHSSFLSLANAMKLEEPFKRVRRWWKSARDELVDRNHQLGRTSPHLEVLGSHSLDGDPEQDPSAPVEDLETSAAPSSSNPGHTPGDSPPPSNSTFLTPPSSSSMTSRHLPRSNSSTLPEGAPSSGPRSFRSRFGATSDFELNKGSVTTAAETTTCRAEYVPSPILTKGFTSVAYGWHAEGDGLDQLISFPKPKRPSTLGPQFHTLQCSDLMDPDDDDTDP
ncbi:hypothetical protein BGX31_007034 [Mortierella sp. GBA43]|nr:hypothetical protein BGX31_007034 [Mortierella sp. GBA43]